MKLTDRIIVDADYDRILNISICQDRRDKEFKALIDISYQGYCQEVLELSEEQIQKMLTGLTIVQNEIQKRNSSKKKRRKKKSNPKPKEEVEVQIVVINPIPIL